MKIHTLHLSSYGKFKDKTISFEDGINYIYGKNEAGKTTIMAFIKAMLYGFSGRGADGDRKRYMPWDGGKLSGEMAVTLKDGRKVIISRSSGRTPAQDEFRVLDALTGETCTVDLASEIGIGENAFLKTVFIRQMGMDPEGGDDELTDKLINLAGSGDADTGYEDAMHILKDSIRTYKHQRGDGGLINELKKEITSLNAQIEEAQAEKSRYTEYALEEKKLQEEIHVLQTEQIKASKQLLAAQAWKIFVQQKEAQKRVTALAEGKKETEERLTSLREKQAEYAVFSNEIGDAAFETLENPEPLKLQGKALRKKQRFFLMGIISSLVLSVASFLLRQYPIGCALLVLSVLLAGFTVKQKKTKEELTKKLDNIEKKEENRKKALSVFDCSTLKEYTEKRAEKLALDEKITALSEKCVLLSAQVQTAEEEVCLLAKKLEKFSDITPQEVSEEEAQAGEARIKQLLSEKIKKAATLAGVLQARQNGERAADVLLSARTCKEEELFEAEETLAALQLAAETLESVFAQLSRDFTPRINEKASLYMTALTGRENEKLLLDKKYTPTMGRGEHRPLKGFSGGTIDQAFFAVRLAIADLVLADENMPLFLDDSFMQYDEEREGNALALLRTIAKKRQVFWFSCRDRKTENMNKIEL